MLIYVEEEDIKPNLAELYGTASSPTPADPPLSHYPPDQPTDLCSDEYPGPLNFEVYVMPNEQKTPWEYSTKLKKIYILANMKFPVAFGVRTRPPDANLFVRATPVFSQAQYFQEVVQRCFAHQNPQDASNQDVAPHVLRHIIRCSNSDTVYCGSNEDRSRLNLVIPLSTPQAGTEVVKEFFSFVCQNSCPSGMNRRPIEVIFTLENQRGLVLGRRVLCARICKCPKRDREKEEGVVKEQAPQGKKRKLNHSNQVIDTRLISLKDLNIVGKHNQIEVIKFCRCLMAGEIIKLEGKNGDDAPFRKCYNDLNAMLSQAEQNP